MTPILAHFIGMQYSRLGSFPLYTLLEPIGDQHPAGSTVSRNTIAFYGLVPVEPVELSHPHTHTEAAP